MGRPRAISRPRFLADRSGASALATPLVVVLLPLLLACGAGPQPEVEPSLSWSAVHLDDTTWDDTLDIVTPPSDEDPLWGAAELVTRTDTFPRTRRTFWLRTRRPLPTVDRGQSTTGYLNLQGRARLFVDGVEVARVEPLASGDTSEPFSSVRRFAFEWPDRPEVDLHVLYAEPFPDGLEWYRPMAGFVLVTGPQVVTERAFADDQRQIVRQQTGLATLFAAQALVHLLLFLFYPRIRSNLWFAITAFLSALMVSLQFQRALVEDLALLGPIYQTWNAVFFLTMVMLLRFSHEVFDRPLGRVYWVVTAIGVVGATTSLVVPAFDAFTTFSWWALIVLILCVRAALQALREGWSGAWILLIGFGFLTAGLVGQRLLLSGVWATTPWPVFPIAYYGVAGLLVMTSVYLAFHFARAITRLREQVSEIEQLSQRNLEQQLEAMELATEQRVLEADNRRKTDELEEARRLQLALLPRELPDLDELEIAVSMDTATEVGGDFYDFYFDAECGLIVAIGDAAGHGARAGSMVSLMKGLFSNFGPHAGVVEELPTLLGRTNQQVRDLGIRRLQMALTVVRACGHELTLAAAGMPPPLLWRAATGEVEEIDLSGLPLGALDGTQYLEQRRDWRRGDVLLLMSDGLPEMQRDDGTVVGYEDVRELFAQSADLGPEELIERLREYSQHSSAGLLSDDVTFVALRNRSREGSTHNHG